MSINSIPILELKLALFMIDVDKSLLIIFANSFPLIKIIIGLLFVDLC